MGLDRNNESWAKAIGLIDDQINKEGNDETDRHMDDGDAPEL